MAKKNSGLGRGLDAIFLDNTLVDEGTHGEERISKLKISLVDPKRDQPRKYFDKEALEQLASSIRENGVLQPLLVRPISTGNYQIIAGERRWRASKIAGLSEVPVVIRDDLSDEQVMQIALIENVQREDLNPVEEAMAYRALMEEYELTQEELSEKVGKSRSAIANTTRLLDLPDEILTLVAAKTLSAGHARTLLGVKDREDMILLAQRTVEYDFSVRQLEEEVKRANKPKKPEPEEEIIPAVDYFREMAVKVQSHLGRRVEINGKGRKKSITLFYEDNEDLDELLKTICGDDFLNDY